jgi:hypothetical protein
MVVWQENEGTHAILTQPPVYNIDYFIRVLLYRFLVYNIGVEEPDVMEVLFSANLNF